MNLTEKQQIISQIVLLLEQLIETQTSTQHIEQTYIKDKPLEMLTIKECAELVSGLSEHTIRQLAAQGKVEYIRAGSGVRGKILVSKASLLKYLGIAG